MKRKLLQSGKKHFTILIISICLVLVSLPFLLIKFLPSTDLPQHLAQIRLLQDIIAGPAQNEYTIDWLGANTLIYYLLGFNWLIFTPVLAGKLAVLEIALAWVVSIFYLSSHKQRSTYSAILACVFIFNASLYWGFLNFLIGFPIFTLWYLQVVDYNKKRSIFFELILIFIISCLLFLAHTLWLLVAGCYFVIITVRKYHTLKEIGLRLLALTPIVIYSAFWFPRFSAIRASLGFNVEAIWFYSPLQRIQPQWIIQSVFGGLHGPVEAIIFSGVLVWIMLAIKTNWGKLRKRSEIEFLYLGAFLAIVVFFAPEKYVNTIYFASRWAPAAMVFFLLALPAPSIKKSVILGYALISLLILSFATCYYWHCFETTDNSGLEESLALIEDGSRVIGLDFVQRSEILYGRPFLQTFAYSQVLHGGRLNFSFAEHHSGIVSFTNTKMPVKWTQGLEWEARNVRQNDITQFNFALINGIESAHNILSSKPELRPLTSSGRWRLYKCAAAPDSLR